MCHIADQNTFLTKVGKDISLIFLQRATMMANSAKDPLWQAKLTAEVAEHPALQQVIEEDVDGNVTHTLLRGAAYKKDNRLPPKGFNESYEGYEDIKIAGNAADDENFNLDQAGIEGTGSDLVHYKIPVRICSTWIQRNYLGRN